MEDLKKQRRARFSGPPQQTESFRGDNKGQSWFRRQFSRQRSWELYTSDVESAAAIAAAAFAIYSIKEEDTSRYDNITRDGISRRISVKEARDAGEASIRKPMGEIFKGPENAFPTRKQSLSSRENKIGTKADAWEKAEMEKIIRRSEKMKYRILAWENAKKTKERLGLETKKRELDLRRERKLRHYQMNIARIDEVAEGARAQVEEKRRIQEFVVKEKASKIRSTGKAPVKCFCF